MGSRSVSPVEQAGRSLGLRMSRERFSSSVVPVEKAPSYTIVYVDDLAEARLFTIQTSDDIMAHLTCPKVPPRTGTA